MADLWTFEETERLKRLLNEGKNISEAAYILKRSYESTRHKVRQLRIINKLSGTEPKKQEIPKSSLEMELEKENLQLKQQLFELHQQTRTIVHHTPKKTIKFGIISDTHLGSYYESIEALETVYDIYSSMGVETVYHAGDLIDGQKMYSGHDYEVHVAGFERQIEYLIKTFPKRKNIKTCFITGNHDLCYAKREGVEVGKIISSRRNDMEYLGPEQATILFSPDSKVSMKLQHPGDGTAYAVSYKVQKNVEAMSGGDKPNILVLGHYHKSEYLPCLRNITAFQAGTLQRQTPFMQRKSLAAHTGAWVITLQIDEVSITNLTAEWIYFYEVNNKLELAIDRRKN